MSEKKLVSQECKFAIHIPARAGRPDLHLVKLRSFYDDGTQERAVEYVKDYRRQFGVTKKHLRKAYEQKKESEPFTNLMLYESTQSELDRSVARALDKGWSSLRLNQLAESPYLYGTDVSSTSLIKNDYQKKYPGVESAYDIAFGDIETDVLHGTDDPIITSMTHDGKVEICVLRSFLGDTYNVEERFMRMMQEHLGDDLRENNLVPVLKIVEDPVELMKAFIHPLHESKPDFLAFWNMDFDIPRLLDTCKKYQYKPTDLFCDPKLPEEIRFCKYKKGSTKKVTASGAVKPRNPSEQWHSLLVPASFYIIDPMSSYRYIRQGAQEEPSYGLDAILTKHLKRGKLKIGNTENSEGLAWHELMQERYKVEYLVYAAFDTLGMYLLEKMTKDLSSTLPVQAGISDFSRFNSQSKRFADDYHFFLWDRGHAISTIPPRDFNDTIDPDDIVDEEDEEEGEVEVDEDGYQKASREGVLGLRDWIMN